MDLSPRGRTFRGWRSGFCRHNYTVGDDELLLIFKESYSAQYTSVFSDDDYVNERSEGSREVARYRPHQWTSVREG